MRVLKSRRAYAGLVATIALRSIARRQLTPFKLLNLARNLGYAVLRRPAVTRLPSIIQVDINNRCNLQCPSCPTGLGQHPKSPGEMSYEAFCGLVDEVRRHVFFIVLYNSGEPFMHRDVYRMIDYAHRRGIGVVTSTNGHYFHGGTNAEKLVHSGLDVMIVSISGVSQDVYAKYHVNGNIDRVVAGLRKVRAAKAALGRRTPAIILRYLTFDHNRRELEEARALAQELEVDYLNVRQAATPEEYEMIRSSVAAHDGAAPDGAVSNHCYWLWSVPTVQHDGEVKPCCLLTLNPPDQGNAFKDGGLSAVWAGERFRRFRHQMLTDKSHIPSCRNCPSFPGMQDRPLKTILSRFRQDPERTAR